MNKLTIIGNLTRDPVLRKVGADISVCDFTVAVNRSRRGQNANAQPEADFFRVTVWRERAEIAAKYLAKGRKVCVVGPVSVSTYQANDGTTRANLEVTAEDFEFLTSRAEAEAMGSGNSNSYAAPASPAAPAAPMAQNSGFTNVETDELPF